MKPSVRIWTKVNRAIVGENMAEVLVTVTDGLCRAVVHAGAAPDEDHARAMVAAMLLSPEDRPPGSVAVLLDAEIERLQKQEASRVMTQKTLSIGDVVKLKTGGPAMTVQRVVQRAAPIGGAVVKCTWFERTRTVASGGRAEKDWAGPFHDEFDESTLVAATAETLQ